MPGAYNNGFPMNYQYMQAVPNPYQYQTTAPAPTQLAYPQQAQQANLQPQADVANINVIPIDEKNEIDKFHLDSGASMMFMLKDDSAIFVKNSLGNGLYTLVEYYRKDSAREDSSAPRYLTREDVEAMLEERDRQYRERRKENKRNEST